MYSIVSRAARLAVVVVLVSAPRATMAQDVARTRKPSPAAAGWIAVTTLVVPTAVAGRSNSNPLQIVAPASILLAPFAGYAYGGIPERAFAPLGRRLAVLGATAGIVGLLCSNNSCGVLETSGNTSPALTVAAVGAVTFAVMTIRDVASVPGAVRNNNAKRIAISPAWIAPTRSPGLSLNIGF